MAAAVLSAPPTTTKYSFKRGDTHVGVWAIQRFLNAIDYADVVEDGIFGPATEAGVKTYQNAVNITADGIVGPVTQDRIVRSCRARAPHGSTLPRGLVEGVIEGESNGLLAAVNASVAGGVDCGLTQRRVYGPPYDPAKVAEAFDPFFNITYTITNENATGMYDRYRVFASRVGNGEYAWRLAALAHNWPSGADQLSRGKPLSETKIATWVPDSVKYPDGTPVRTYADWARFYAMGSKEHQWPGLVTKLAFGIPTQ